MLPKLGSQIIIILLLFISINSSAQSTKEGDYVENIGNLKIHFSIRGKGPVMIVGHLVSGKIGYQQSLKPLEEFFTMVYYEPRGTGLSQSPFHLSDYNQEAIVQEMDLLIKQLNVDKVWLFGHSDQGAIALLYALHFPEHVQGLILSGISLVGSLQESHWRRKESENKRASESKWFKKVIEDWDYMNAHQTNFDENGNDLSDAKIKWWCYNETTFRKVLPIVKAISERGRRKPIDGRLPTESEADRNQYLKNQAQFNSIKVPTLIINGRFDTNNPPQFAAELSRRMLNSKLVIVDKAAHFPWIENPSAFYSSFEKWFKVIAP